MPRKPNPNESVTFGLRMPVVLRERLDVMAQRFGVESSIIIRWACESLASYVEANGGKVQLPLDFSEVFADRDRLQLLLDSIRREEAAFALNEESIDQSKRGITYPPTPLSERPRGRNEPAFDDENPRDQASSIPASPPLPTSEQSPEPKQTKNTRKVS